MHRRCSCSTRRARWRRRARDPRRRGSPAQQRREQLRGVDADVEAGVAGLTDRVLPTCCPCRACVVRRDGCARGRDRGAAAPVERRAGDDVLRAAADPRGRILRPAARLASSSSSPTARATRCEAERAAAFADARHHVVFVRFWRADEAVYDANGQAETAYRPDPGRRRRSTRSRRHRRKPRFGERDVGAAQGARCNGSSARGPDAGRARTFSRRRRSRPYTGRRCALRPAAARAIPCPGFPESTIGDSMTRASPTLEVLGPLVVALLAVRRLVSAEPARASSRGTSAGRLRQHAGRDPALAADRRSTRATSASSGASFTVDFHAIDAGVRRGEQSYPVESNGTLYVTTNDDNVLALDATTGKVKWRWKPDNVAVFTNFGIVANRGVALLRRQALRPDARHDDRLARPGDRKARSSSVAIAQAVPGASVELRLLGDERADLRQPPARHRRRRLGVRRARLRDGVPHRSHAGVAEPVLDDPARRNRAGASFARSSAAASSGRRRRSTPTTNTLYFGTGSATPLYYPALRPGPNPRTDSLDRGRPDHRPA